MIPIEFEVLGAEVVPHAAVPTITLNLRASLPVETSARALALRCQIRIEPQRRRYTPEEESRLYELFGDVPQWGDSLRPFLWTHTSTVVPGFTGTAVFDLPLECTYDFEVAGAKYLHALADGEIPLLLLFSGTLFTDGPAGFSAEPVSWDLQASYRLPVTTWRMMMDEYFPNSGWLRIDRTTLDALQRFRTERALPSWELAFERLLKEAGADGS